MARRTTADEGAAPRKRSHPISSRVGDELFTDLTEIADGLEVDLSNTIRQMLKEIAPTFLERVRELRRRRERARSES